ncbi:hypothetical protein CARUB_v10002915mg [Capsella rubella]|uniref:Manganese/iron superoxide dismutase C-terminal domain-containing protein n=1 Tax=Capsella rubella TaxID=81985 RepID=R0GZE5_9BRAS|nr:hypothetical protein CARUB_v10002915mg [Capsella rubella]
MSSCVVTTSCFCTIPDSNIRLKSSKLVNLREERRLEVVKTSNAINPLVWDDIPIISLDVWEPK